MVNISPKLHLNKKYRAAKNGCLVNATNIMLSPDGNALVNSDPIEKHNHLSWIIGDNKILGHISCNKEIIIFLSSGEIVRYNEELNEGGVVCHTPYTTGTVTGTFTYNSIGELIIQFCFNINSVDCPMSTMNLGHYRSQIEIPFYKQPICPEVIIPTIRDVSGFFQNEGNWYKGWTFVFIRYKINKNDYTQWLFTNASILVDNSEKEVIQSNGGYIDKGGNNKFYMNDRFGFNNAFANVSNELDITNISRTITISNIDKRYNAMQIGTIIVRKDFTKCIYTDDILINEKSNIEYITFDIKMFNNTGAISDMIRSYYNYYNVRKIINDGNRIYISNYKEIVDYNFDNKTFGIGLCELVVLSTNDSQIYVEPMFSRSFIPGVTYNIYVHFVDKYGTSTRGYFVNSVKMPIEEVIKYLKQPNKEANGSFIITLDCETPIIPNGYIGWYLSYEKKEKESYFVGFAKNYDKSVYEEIIDDGEENIKLFSTDIDTNDKLSIRFNKLYSWFDDKIQSINSNTKKYFNSNTLGNIVQWSCCKINTGNYISKNDKKEIAESIIDNYIIPIFIEGAYLAYGGEVYLEGGHVPQSIYKPKYFKSVYFYTLSLETEIAIKLINSKVSKNTVKYVLIENFIEICNDIRNKINNGASKSSIIETLGHQNIFRNDHPVNINIYEAIGGEKLDNIFNKFNVSISDNKFYIAAYGDKIKTNNNIELIPFTQVMYSTKEHFVEINPIDYFYDGFVSKIQCFYNDFSGVVNGDGKVDVLNIYNVESAHLKYENPDIIEKKIGTVVNETVWIKEIPDEFKSFKSKPDVIFYPKGIGQGIGTFVNVKSDNTRDLFQVRHLSLDYAMPKLQYNFDENKEVIFEYDNTIRRSLVIQDESNSNNWRKFDVNAYHIIDENKGKITNMISVNDMFIVHTEHSLFGISKNDKLISKNSDVQLGAIDVFEATHKELFTSELGEGGLQNRNSWILGSFGYIWFNDEQKRFMYLSGDKPKYIDSEIFEFTNSINIRDVIFANDYYRNRLLISFKYNNNSKGVISYNYQINEFISFHKEQFSYVMHTKFNTYFYNDYVYNIVRREENIDKEFNTCKISVLINDNYETNKYIDNIQYKINAPILRNLEVNNNLPVEESDELYNATNLRVHNNETYTDFISTKIDEDYNQIEDYKQPYKDNGRWNFSYIRNIKTSNEVIDDKSSRVYGNYFIVDFTFDKPSRTDNIEIEELSINYSLM